MSTTHTGTLPATTANTFYTITDGATVTLPAATTAGQVLYLVDASGQSASSGFTFNAASGDTLVIGSGGSNSATVQDILISDGANHWYAVESS